ncbi:methylmalonyl Co-A mutase-associated GTPase MeaB [Magnetovibrio sp. PR-2]|uniref:methylmalonyl Co-A mutase-associated GTPase MeaB n=1 Tax=Magnetovibrio sp. PR-2 TaxID=3120356 RepID=UPI002FCE5836
MSDATEAQVHIKKLVDEVLTGKARSVARAMSLAEGRSTDAESLMAELHRHAGNAHIVGLTGVPGAGKSTMVASLTRAFRKLGKTVGIIAIDPSSPFSGGAILGDRVRMTGFAEDEGVFIRSMATRGALGGLARASLDTVDVLDAAGFDIVLIETVGVGQDEVDIVQAAHSVLVVSAPGLGDEIQAIKAGVLEIADIHVVSKCDKPDAPRTVQDLKGMLHLGRPGKGDKQWTIPVIPTSAETGEGMEELAEKVIEHYDHLESSGEMEVRKRQILEMRIIKTAEDMLRERLMSERGGKLQGLLDRAYKRDMDVRRAARDLLGAVTQDEAGGE